MYRDKSYEDWLEGDGPPAPVWIVVGDLRKALEPRTDRDLSGVPSIRVRARSGRWLTLHGARTEANIRTRGRDDGQHRTVQATRTSVAAGSAYGLSKRERAVVDLVVQGASTEEISQTLYISEYTVQDHLSNAFDKVGVRGRRALVKRLFFDNLFPAMLG